MEKVQATLMHIISCFMHDTDFQLSNQLTFKNSFITPSYI